VTTSTEGDILDDLLAAGASCAVSLKAADTICRHCAGRCECIWHGCRGAQISACA